MDLHTTLGCEFRNENAFRDFLEDSRVGLAAQAVVESMQVGSSNDKREMCRLMNVCQTELKTAEVVYIHRLDQKSMDLGLFWGHSRMADQCW